MVQQQQVEQVVHNHFTVVQAQPGGAAEPGRSHKALMRAVVPSSNSAFRHRSKAVKARDDA